MAAVMEIQTALGIILDALNTELAAAGTRESLCSFTVQPGAVVAADYGTEACGGMGWVRLANAWPTVTWPTPATGTQSCGGSTLAYAVEVGILRPCAVGEVFGSEIELPSDDENAADAFAAFDDMRAMFAALRKVASRFEQMSIGTYTPAGPEGGVSGGTWAVTLGLD